MNIYKATNKGLVEVQKEPFPLEKDIQLLVEKNLDQLFGLQFVATEFTIGEYRLDTLAFDRESSAFVIVEYKKGHSYSVIDQGYSYLSTMLDNKADFVLEYNERVGKLLKNDVDWSSSRVIFVSPSFNTYQKNSVNFKDVPFELWEIKRFSGDLVVLDQHKSSSKESIESLGQGSRSISTVSTEVKVVDENEHYEKCSEGCLEQWRKIQDYFNALDDTSYKVRKPYISIVKGNMAICYAHFQRDGIRLDVTRGGMTAEGDLTSKFFYLDDPKGVALEHERNWQDGKRMKYEIRINKKTDLEYVLWLLKQKYDSI
jgi:hypothetical protein